MFKSLLKDTSLYASSNVVARGFSLITVPIFTRILSPSDYGALDILTYLALFIPLLFGLALDQAVSRFYIDSECDLRKKQIASTVIIYYIVILFIVVVMAFPFSDYIAQNWLNGQVGRRTMNMVFIFIWIKSVYYAANNQLKWRFESKKFAVCNIGNVILSTILTIIFIVFFRWSIFGLFLGQSISQAIFSIISLYLGRSSYIFNFDWTTFKEMIRYSLPLMPATIAFFAMQYADRVALKELVGLAEVGIYGIGARLASIIQLILMGFQGAWHPLVIKYYRKPDIQKRFVKVFHYFIFVTAFTLLSLSLFGKEILVFFTPSTFSKGYIVVSLLIGSLVMASIANYFTYGILIEKKTKIKAYINLFGIAINIFLNILFIKLFGLIGAALATFLSFFIIATIGMTISQKLYYVPYNWGKIITTLSISFGLSLIPLLYDFEISIQNIFFKFLLISLSMGVTIFIIKIVNLKEMSLFIYNLLPKRIKSFLHVGYSQP